MQCELLMHVKEGIQCMLGVQYHIYVKCPPAINGLVRPLIFDLQVAIKFLAHCCAVDGFTFINPCCLEILVCELSQRCTMMLNSTVSL